MKKISLALALCCASFYSMADQLPLGGFSYGPMEAPTGKEWESPENLALNKEQPHEAAARMLRSQKWEVNNA